MLTEAQAESMQRIAAHCARTNRASTPFLSMGDRYEAALDSIVEYVHDHGWTDDPKDLYRAGSNGIGRAGDESAKHIRHTAHWREAPPGDDVLAESVTDRLAVWQIVWSLTDAEWEAVWALAYVKRRDGRMTDAAALLGIGDSAFSMRLHTAREKCRALWVAQGDTPPRRYFAEPRGKRSKAAGARYYRNYATRKKAA